MAFAEGANGNKTVGLTTKALRLLRLVSKNAKKLNHVQPLTFPRLKFGTSSVVTYLAMRTLYPPLAILFSLATVIGWPEGRPFQVNAHSSSSSIHSWLEVAPCTKSYYVLVRNMYPFFGRNCYQMAWRKVTAEKGNLWILDHRRTLLHKRLLRGFYTLCTYLKYYW